MVTLPVVRPWIDPYLRGDAPLLNYEASSIDRESYSCGPGGSQQCLLPEGKAEHANQLSPGAMGAGWFAAVVGEGSALHQLVGGAAASLRHCVEGFPLALPGQGPDRCRLTDVLIGGQAESGGVGGDRFSFRGRECHRGGLLWPVGLLLGGEPGVNPRRS